MNSGTDISSLASSIELKDALIDTIWFRPGETHSTMPTGNKWNKRIKEAEVIKLREYINSHRPFYIRWYQAYKLHALKQRLKQYEIDEMQSLLKQKLRKINDIIREQDIKSRLISSIVLKPDHVKSDPNELTRKYGANLICWLEDVGTELNRPPLKIIEQLTHDYTCLKTIDPLSNWTKQRSELYCRMLERINTFASTMADMVKYSFIIEPGTITPHLSEYIAEFQQLETFFERNPLSLEEIEQKAFNRNLSKTRNKYDNGSMISSKSIIPGSSHLYHMTDDILKPINMTNHSDDKSDDFIHASYVRGGPLLNTFILTQAPLTSTINDFWQMVWQERSKYIIMLCKAVNVNRLGFLDGILPNTCLYYWPRYENDKVQYGDYIICNHKVDCTIDPLFNVTHLTIQRAHDNDGSVHKLEHWQYDWNDFNDFYWPLRILRRIRLSPTPTIIHCLNGCGRSGTLVTIEVLLMHLLRGSARYNKLVLTTAIFVRLQRHHAISSPLQYLFIYRTLLHWMQPFITSNITRFILGLIFPDWGFIGKYQKMINCYSRFE
ncbi:Protein CBR-EGG-3 [Dirofilaria immitis]|nr:Protein CBR-EGG-3 [Dirofilaria immitis]